ncbi:MAG: rod-binding protein [Spirochaetaceae bacterium]|jgi:flagellar protein FlgJ|nr:rod-binding protein [Spirochaetaceae bacterium]
MSIESVASFYMDNARLTPSRVSAPAAGGTAFAEVLEKAREDAPLALAGQDAGTQKPVVDKGGKLYEQCEALETFLVKILLTGMRNTVQKSEFLDGGFAGKMYEDMLYDEYAKDFTKNAEFGLAELAYLELTGQRGKLLDR